MDLLKALRQFFRDNPRMWLVVGLAVLATGALAAGIYGGFGFEIGQFFAAEVTPTPQLCTKTVNLGPGECPPKEAVCYGVPEGCGWSSDGSPAWALRVGHLDMDPVSGLLFNTGRGDPNDHRTWEWFTAPSSIEGWCASDNQLASANPPPQAPSLPTSPRCPDGSDGGSNRAAYPYCGRDRIETIQAPCESTPTPIAVTVSTPTPTPVTPVLCAPDTQAAAPNVPVYLEAIGGSNIYQWNVTGGGLIEAGGNENITISYSGVGTKYVRVNSGGTSALCIVIIQVPGAGETPLVVDKRALNETRGDQTPSEVLTVGANIRVQFVTTVRSLSSQPLTNLVFRDELPPGMTYVVGSTLVENQQLTVDTVTTTGLPLGTLQPGDGFTVRWSAIADALSGGSFQDRPVASVTADGISVVSDTVALSIGGSSVSGPAGVPTGADHTIVFAMALSGIVTLLYAAYTRSGTFHRHEVHQVTRKRSPLDFRL